MFGGSGFGSAPALHFVFIHMHSDHSCTASRCPTNEINDRDGRAFCVARDFGSKSRDNGPVRVTSVSHPEFY